MQAQLTIRRFPTALLAFIVALAVAIVLGAALGYALKGASIAAVHTQGGVTVDQAAGDPRSDLTRVLPKEQTVGGPQSDLTRALPTAQPPRDESCLYATTGLTC